LDAARTDGKQVYLVEILLLVLFYFLPDLLNPLIFVSRFVVSERSQRLVFIFAFDVHHLINHLFHGELDPLDSLELQGWVIIINFLSLLMYVYYAFFVVLMTTSIKNNSLEEKIRNISYLIMRILSIMAIHFSMNVKHTAFIVFLLFQFSNKILQFVVLYVVN